MVRFGFCAVSSMIWEGGGGGGGGGGGVGGFTASFFMILSKIVYHGVFL